VSTKTGRIRDKEAIIVDEKGEPETWRGGKTNRWGKGRKNSRNKKKKKTLFKEVPGGKPLPLEEGKKIVTFLYEEKTIQMGC